MASAKKPKAKAKVRLRATKVSLVHELAQAKKTIRDLEAKLEKAAPKPDPVPKTLEGFTKPPDDPLEAQASLYRMLVLSAYDAATDKDLSSEDRRKEIRTITAAAAKLFPESRRWEVEQLIRADRAEIEKRTSEKGGGKIEPMP